MIQFRGLGQCVFEVGTHRVTPESDVLFALLLYLTSKHGKPAARAELLDLLWPTTDPAKARHRLRQALYQLKRLGAPIRARDSFITVDPIEIHADVSFAPTEKVSAALLAEQNLGCEYLPHYAPHISTPYAKWVENERDRVHALLRRSLLDAVRESRAQGDYTSSLVLARKCLELDSFADEAALAIAEATAIVRGAQEALAILEGLRAGLVSSSAALALKRRIIAAEERASRSSADQDPLVGRTEIVREIRSWTADKGRSSRIVVLSGEPGIGKTRLLGEASRVAMLQGLRTVQYRPSANGGNRPLAGLLDLVPLFLGLPGAVGCNPESYARLTELGRSGQGAAPIPEDIHDSTFRFAALRRSVLDLIDAISSESQLLVAVDDAHCLDRPTLEILSDSARSPGSGLLLLLTTRPTGSFVDTLNPRTDVRSIRVQQLDVDSSRLVITRRLSRDALARRSKVIDWSIEIAGGNPFFLVELAAHCNSESAGESLPASLKIALERRVDALSAPSRLVLQSCAVLGQNSTLERLEAMLEMSAHAIAAALSELDNAGLTAARDASIVCRHDLISEAVTETLGPTLKSYLHRRCALVLDAELRAAPTASLAWDSAHHWDAAGEHKRAFERTAQIAEQLLLLGLPQAAADLCARAERYCKTTAQDADRLLRLSRAQRQLDDWNGVVQTLERRRTLLNGPTATRHVYTDDEIALFEARWWRDHDGRVLLPAIHRVRDVRAPTLHRLQMAVIALVIADNHQRKRVAQRIFEAVEDLDTVTPREDTEKARATLVFHTAFGSLDIAVSAASRVVQFERLTGESAALLRALRWAATPLKFAGHTREATAVLEEAYERAMHLGLRTEMWHAAEYLTSLAVECEDVELGRKWAPLCIQLAEEDVTQTSKINRSRYLMCRASLMCGDTDAARRIFSIESISAGDALLRTRARETIIAMETLLRVRTASHPIPSEMLTEFRRLHLTTRESGVRDFETGALLVGLIGASEIDIAREIRRDYISHFRRSRLPLHSMFAETEAALY
jgi:DNA-binding SARP family transcriptional activator